jgi:hypothetical protein
MQARWDRVVNQILENDRRESVARQRAVFTTVSLFLSTFFVAMIKPPLWQNFGVFRPGDSRDIVHDRRVASDSAAARVLSHYYTIGLTTFITRLRRREKAAPKPFTRFSASAFLLGGYAVSLGIGC